MILKSSYIYQCGERYDKMRVITLQVSAVWYKSDWEGGGRENTGRRKGGGCLAACGRMACRTSQRWWLRLTWQGTLIQIQTKSRQAGVGLAIVAVLAAATVGIGIVVAIVTAVAAVAVAGSGLRRCE